MRYLSFLPDPYTLSLAVTVIVASILPTSGVVADVLALLTSVAIGFVFFLHGIKLSREAILKGAVQWRFHLLVLACTFVLYPLLGLLLQPGLQPLLDPELFLGFMFMCMLPSTVQSAITLTGLAKGNVPAAICAASFSTVLGIFVTPLLVSNFVIATDAEVSALESIKSVFLKLMLPFIAGHLVRPWVFPLIQNRGRVIGLIDRGAIILVVYTAFSAAVIGGLWERLSAGMVVAMVLGCLFILGVVMLCIRQITRVLGIERSSVMAALFVGSQKSLATGIPMAQVLFPVASVGTILLPVMIFHQVQLLVSSILANKFAAGTSSVT